MGYPPGRHERQRMNPIIIAYANIAMTDYPDDYKAWLNNFPHDRARALRAAAECAYIQDHGEMPAWATVLEGFEIINGAYLFIERDPDAVS